jgi:hypothetical protein
VEDEIAELVVRWLSYCLDEHTQGFDCSSRELSDIFSDDETIVLVDVVRLKLVEGKTSFKYVALSYIWGSVNQVCTKSAFLEALKAPNSLSMVWSRLSRVIQDAINFVDKIGERYLWVDTLCIVQDDDKSKHHQLDLMAEIYNRAILTLVACHGQDANQPLMLDSYCTKQLLAKEIPSQEEIQEKILQSKHSKRGWTFQETMLSRRKLYFLTDEIYFQCRDGVYRALGNAPNSTPAATLLDNWPPPWNNIMKNLEPPLGTEAALQGLGWPSGISSNDYHAGFQFWAHTISMYCKREFSFDSDVLRACSGILFAFQSYTKWNMYQGMPETLLDLALLWTPSTSFQSRRAADEGVKFPTWSWLAWRGEITWNLVQNGDRLIDFESQLRFHNESHESNIDTFAGRLLELVDSRDGSLVERIQAVSSETESSSINRLQKTVSAEKLYPKKRIPKQKLKQNPKRYGPSKKAVHMAPSLRFQAFCVELRHFTTVKSQDISNQDFEDKAHWTWMENSNKILCLVLFDQLRHGHDNEDLSISQTNDGDDLFLILLSDTRLSAYWLVNHLFMTALAAEALKSMNPLLRDGFTYKSEFENGSHLAKSAKTPMGTIRNVMLVRLVKEVVDKTGWVTPRYYERVAVGQIWGECWEACNPTLESVVLR